MAALPAPGRPASPAVVIGPGAAVLLSFAGGCVDAFTYVGHGQVFANSMTGNVVLLGAFLLLGETARALRHVPPLAAFFVGVFAARALRRFVPRAPALGLGVEIAVLAACCLLPRSFPDLPLVLAIALVGAIQHSGFTRVDEWAYNSVLATANLRRCAESLFDGLAEHRNPLALREARVFGAVCLAFLGGACAGGLLTPRWGNAALAVPVAALAAVFARLLPRFGASQEGGLTLGSSPP